MRSRREFLTVGLSAAAGCARAADAVVLYCSLDREFAEPVLARLQRDAGLTLAPLYDAESTKSVGLTERLRREAARPRCDVFWNNEVLNTVRLARAGLLEPYQPPAAVGLPPSQCDPGGRWHGFAARARVLLVHSPSVPADAEPQRLADLADPKWKGRFGLAKPLFGTTATHVAALFATLGPADAKALLSAWKANDVQILSGNKRVAVEVGAGTLACGLTDTDDALAEIDAGRPVRAVFLDRRPDELGTLLLPNTIAVVKNGPRPDLGKRLVDAVLTPAVEDELAAGPSGQIPLHRDARTRPRLELPADVRRMPVDYEKSADAWDEAMKFAADLFTA
ncbi:MAG: extracellular solute-binding protein [Planctomycetia bacterium]